MKKSEFIHFVWFGNRVFSVRWQGLRIMKYKMDSNPRIISSNATHANMCANLRHLSADLSYIYIAIYIYSVIFQLTIRILTNSQLSIEPQPEPSQRINMHQPCVQVKRSEFWVATITRKWLWAMFWVTCKQSPTEAMTCLKKLSRSPKQNNVSNDST